MAGAAWHPERQGQLYIPISFQIISAWNASTVLCVECPNGAQLGMPRRCSAWNASKVLKLSAKRGMPRRCSVWNASKVLKLSAFTGTSGQAREEDAASDNAREEDAASVYVLTSDYQHTVRLS